MFFIPRSFRTKVYIFVKDFNIDIAISFSLFVPKLSRLLIANNYTINKRCIFCFNIKNKVMSISMSLNQHVFYVRYGSFRWSVTLISIIWSLMYSFLKLCIKRIF